jgi:hypothetical protein
MSGTIAKRIFLSGPTLNQAPNSHRHFEAAVRLLYDKFPLAEVCSSHALRAGLSSKHFNTICRTRIRGWATDFVYLESDYSTDAFDSLELIEHRSMAEERGLKLHVIRDGSLISSEVP